MHKRILFLGPTGIDKASASSRLSDYVAKNLGHSVRVIDFENDYLKPKMRASASNNWTAFLAQDIVVQAAAWRSAWDDLKDSLSDGVVVLGLHATYVSTLLGLRCALDIGRICDDYRPTLIITLVDDVFSMWRRTEGRAGGSHWKGRPDLESLLSARRSEQILGDMILSHAKYSSARHILCATSNTIVGLSNLIFFDASVTYLSFPISAPRRRAEGGDYSFIELINEAHNLAAAEMHQDRKRCFISPLAIDELPLLSKASGFPGEEDVEFNPTTDRWNVEDLWGAGVDAIVPSANTSCQIPKSQVHAAGGMIRTDVGWRDRRLVQQSGSLAIVCPKPPGEDRITRGVNDEIQTAAAVGTVCYLWQKPDWDLKDFVGNTFPAPGSMGMSQIQALVNRVGTLDELIRSKP